MRRAGRGECELLKEQPRSRNTRRNPALSNFSMGMPGSMRTSRKDQQRPYSTGDPFCHGDPFSKATLAPFNDCPDAVPRASIHLEPP
ncbi:hypothetical protein CDAR_307961 [Caerostris darwini]|uniref:Uncharacterized protein n=1 Tax=Caerostris darwini TaxID=1538125 RepID=A0AAV4P8D5_9ARAC|nr:hypothetical protein CDAR_307961 [Caerostris darwini]